MFKFLGCNHIMLNKIELEALLLRISCYAVLVKEVYFGGQHVKNIFR